jgi:hypothetical protein
MQQTHPATTTSDSSYSRLCVEKRTNAIDSVFFSVRLVPTSDIQARFREICTSDL